MKKLIKLAAFIIPALTAIVVFQFNFFDISLIESREFAINNMAWSLYGAVISIMIIKIK